MTARTPTYLKARYEQGDIPQGTDYEDLMDSYLNVVVSAEQSIDSNFRTTKEIIAASVSANNFNAVSATSVVSPVGRFTTVSAGALYTDDLYLGTVDISALSTTQSSAVLVNGLVNFIIFADGNNTAVRLPTSTRGKTQSIINAASTTIKIFPAVSGRFLVTAANASLNIPADRTALVFHKGDDRYGIIIGGF